MPGTIKENSGSKGFNFPKIVSKYSGYWKVITAAAGAISALWITFTTIYAVPLQLKAHEIQLAEQKEMFNTHHNRLDQLDIYKSSNLTVMVDVKDSLQRLIEGQEKNNQFHQDLNTCIVKTTTGMEYIKDSVDEIKKELREIKDEQVKLKDAAKTSFISNATNSFTNGMVYTRW